jgi:hypothetical protein
MVAIVVSVVSAVAALAAVLITYLVGSRNAKATERAARAAEETQALSARQLESTVAAHQAATQPYVWLDLRPRDDGGVFSLVVGNSGPTVATEVRVILDPDLAAVIPDPERYAASAISNRLRSGLRSLAPGRVLEWNIGVGHMFYAPGGLDPADVKVTINADGPHGPVPELQYVISLGDLRNSSARGRGLALLEKPMERIANAVEAAENRARNIDMRAGSDVLKGKDE